MACGSHSGAVLRDTAARDRELEDMTSSKELAGGDSGGETGGGRGGIGLLARGEILVIEGLLCKVTRRGRLGDSEVLLLSEFPMDNLDIIRCKRPEPLCLPPSKDGGLVGKGG